MVEQVGIKAVLDDKDFQRGLQSYLRGLSRAQGETQQASSSVGRAWSGMGHAVNTAFAFVVGNVIVDGFRRISGAAMDAATQSFEAVASYERLGLSLTTLVARELKGGQERTIMTQQRISLTEKEREKLEDLRDVQESLAADIPAAQARLEELMAGKWVGPAKAKRLEFEDPRIVNERQQALDAMREKLGEVTAAIAELEAKEGTYAAVQSKVWVNQIAMNEAMDQASPRVRELIEWIEMLAIKSPFGIEAVAQAFRMAMVYGFTTKEAQRLTQATLDFAAGSGLSGDALERVNYALGQMHLEGKATAYVLRHLALAGLPVRTILAAAFKVSTERMQEMLEEGLVPADKAIEAIVKTLEEDFGGAAARQAESLAGLKESLIDLKGISLRELFGGTWRAAQPFLAGLVHTLASPEFRERLRGVGNQLGDVLKSVLGLLRGTETFPNLLYKLGATPEQQMYLSGLAEKMGELWAGFKEAWLQPALDAVGRALGTIWAAVKELMAGDFKGALKELGFDDATVKRIERAALGFEIIGKAVAGVLTGRPARVPTSEDRKYGPFPPREPGLEEAFVAWGVPPGVAESVAALATALERAAVAVAEFIAKTLTEAAKLDWSFLRQVSRDIADNFADIAELLTPLLGEMGKVGEKTGWATTLASALRDIVWAFAQIIIYGQQWGVSMLGKFVEAMKSLVALDLVNFFRNLFGAMGQFFAFFLGLPELANLIANPPWADTNPPPGMAPAHPAGPWTETPPVWRPPQGPVLKPPWRAQGADYLARWPHIIGVGDVPERVTITPLTQAGQGWLGPLIGSMTIHAPGGPAQVRRAAYLGVLDDVRAVGLK